MKRNTAGTKQFRQFVGRRSRKQIQRLYPFSRIVRERFGKRVLLQTLIGSARDQNNRCFKRSDGGDGCFGNGCARIVVKVKLPAVLIPYVKVLQAVRYAFPSA